MTGSVPKFTTTTTSLRCIVNNLVSSSAVHRVRSNDGSVSCGSVRRSLASCR